MSWGAERTAEFDVWWSTLTDPEQRKVVAAVEALQELGPTTGRPLVDSVEGSRHSNMKELRVTRTMRRMIPIADSIYQQHLQMMDYKDEETHAKAKTVRRAKRRGS